MGAAIAGLSGRAELAAWLLTVGPELRLPVPDPIPPQVLLPVAILANGFVRPAPPPADQPPAFFAATAVLA